MKSLSGPIAIMAVFSGNCPVFAMVHYKWKYRPLVVFSQNEAVAPLDEQRLIVAGSRSGLAERYVVVIWVVGNWVSAEFGAHPGVSAKTLGDRFGLTVPRFRALLIGKDGGTKLSSVAPLSGSALNATIDSMPMRQNEMRRP